MWLSTSAVRSGEDLLRAQLDSAADRAAALAQSRWDARQSDVLLLASSVPVRVSLEDATGPDTAPTYARRAFATMPSITNAVALDSRGRERWKLGEEPYSGTASPGAPRVQQEAAVVAPFVRIRADVTDDGRGVRVGEIEASVRLDALTSATPAAEVAPSQFLAVHDREGGDWLAPAGLNVAALRGDRFSWLEHSWLATHRRLERPAMDIVAAAQLDPFLVPFARSARLGELALALSALGVVLLTIVVTARLTRSIGMLAVAADRVSSGDLDTHVDTPSQDEVGRVGRAFNEMIDNVRRMMRELSQREAVSAMGELAATLAHQLRSPATAIRLDVQRAHDKLPADSPERGLLARALTQLDRLDRAVTGSLRVARTAGAERAPIDVCEPLRRAAAALRHEYDGRVSVDDSSLPHEAVLIRGDVSSLEQLFVNVITNGAQAAPRGGRVSVSMEASGSDAIVIIRDNGYGMSMDVLVRAGQPMFSTKPEGTGLGLAIAKRIAAAHGGTLTIDSAANVGTTVRITLPVWSH
jgi:signal transduction histidine kinase